MPLNVARGGSALRSLYLHAVSRPFRVAIPKPHVRHVSLAMNRGPLKPVAGAAPSSTLLSRQLVNTYATASESKTDKKKTTKAAPKKKTTTTKTKKTAAKPKRKELTDKQKADRAEKKKIQAHKERISELKSNSLEPPKRGSNSWWTYALKDILPEVLKTHENKQEGFRAAVERIRNFSQEEKDRYAGLAQNLRDRYDSDYEEFIKSHTPAQIRDANRARRRLATLTGGRYSPLRDERLVKPAKLPYTFYFNERFETGDFKYMSLNDMQTRIREEYKGLTPSEKQKYSKLAEADRARYAQECQKVYGDQPSAN